MADVLYTFKFKYPNGFEKKKKIPLEPRIVPFAVMKLRQQHSTAVIEWSGANGDFGTTEVR